MERDYRSFELDRNDAGEVIRRYRRWPGPDEREVVSDPGCGRCGCEPWGGRLGERPETAVDPRDCGCTCHDGWKIINNLPPGASTERSTTE